MATEITFLSFALKTFLKGYKTSCALKVSTLAGT